MNKYRAYIKYLLEAISPKVINRMKEIWKKENNTLTDGMMDYYIRSFEKYKSSDKVIEKDITKYTFKELEKIIDSNFIQHHKQQENKITDEPIYNQDGLTVYEAPNRESCISIGKREKWCISRTDASNMYNSYRFALQEPNFYFIKNNKLPSNNIWSFFVLMVLNNGYYSLASRDNSGEFTGSKQISWEEVLKNVPFLKDVKDLFKSKPLTEFEKEVYQKVKPKVSNSDLLEHFGSLYLVGEYIGIGHSLSSNQFLNLNNPELRMKYINLGHDLLENEVLQSLTSSEMNRYISVKVQVDGHLNLKSLTSLPNNITFPEKIEGDVDLSRLELFPDNVMLPKIIGGSLILDGLKSLPDNFKFPETIDRSLILDSLTSLPNNIIFPSKIGGLYSHRLKSLPDNFKFPEKIGNIFMYGLKSLPDNFKFPEKIDMSLDLRSLKSLPNNVILPKNIGLDLNFNGLTSLPDNFKFPETIGRNLHLDGLPSLPDGIKFPQTIGGSLDLFGLKSLPNNIKFPITIDISLYLPNLNEIPQEVWDNMTKQVRSKVHNRLKRSN